ncbi:MULTISPECIES: DUF3035 domain-containing protein [Acidiphilium]|uniref:DUF3035 domain-containing protein n=1 Tax=Acidiphilium iwatense TaxID=768198 RepID=A0ABS9DYD8_9PROT|nr:MULTISPECIES: DUF3035 domain-containing protein [Acidiphilium]MCF3946706.1 DUF3035 domain-containing protein [Acidiphilium iwatense]
MMLKFRPTSPALRASTPVLLGVIAIGSTLGLAGCSGAAKTFGLEVTPPNAYEVATEAPLSIPPELGTLPAPQPGAPRPQQISASQQAEEVLAPQTALANADTSMGPGQQALLQEAGPTPPAGIRAEVDRQANLQSRSPDFLHSLMSFGGSGQTSSVVNASAEQRRLQENAALGEPATKGATPHQSATQSKGLLNRLLGIF